MVGLEKDLSGDSLTYAVGPRWLGRIRGGWTAQLQVLVGGNKVTEERMYPEMKKLLEAIAIRDRQTAARPRRLHRGDGIPWLRGRDRRRSELPGEQRDQHQSGRYFLSSQLDQRTMGPRLQQ